LQRGGNKPAEHPAERLASGLVRGVAYLNRLDGPLPEGA